MLDASTETAATAAGSVDLENMEIASDQRDSDDDSPQELTILTEMLATPMATPPNSTGSVTPSEASAATTFRVEEDGLGIKGYLSMRDEGVTYHRMKRYYSRCVGVNFFRFSSRETANVLINAVFGAEIARVEPWDGRGLLHTYRNAFKLYFTNGVVFNADADSEDDKKAWIEYIDSAIRGAADAASLWQRARASELLVLSHGGLAFADKKAAGSSPKFKNDATCSHQTCSSRFDSTSKRQHHCRNCGGSVCSDHSYRFSVLRHYHMNDAVRLCTSCFRVQRFTVWLSMLVQRLSIARVAPVTPRVLTPSEQEEVDALLTLLNDGLFGISDVIQVLHLHRHGPDEAYLHAVDKLLELSSTNLTDFEFFLPQIFHMWLTMDWTSNNMKSAMLFRVVCYAAQLHVRFATSLYWLARATVDDSCGWGFGQSELYIPDYLYRKLSMCKLLMINLEMQILQSDWHFEPDKDIPASELQTMMIRCLFDRLQLLVAAKPSGYGSVCGAVSALALPAEYVEGEDFSPPSPPPEVLRENRAVFTTQIEFIHDLCEMTERLRKIPPEERKPALKEELAAIMMPENAFCPIGSCEDALLRFIAIVRNEGTVFTTRARAPTLVFFEVEHMSSFNGQNSWLQRAETPVDMYGNEIEGSGGPDVVGSIEYDATVTVDGSSGDPGTQSTRRSKNAIEMATSSAIAQAIPAEAYEVQDGDDRISEAFKTADQFERSVDVKSGSKYSAFEEDEDESVIKNDEDEDDDDDELRDRVASSPRGGFTAPLSRENSNNLRRRSGSLMTMTTRSLDTLLSAYNETFAGAGRRRRSVSEGNDKDFEPKTTTMRDDFESFTKDQLMTMAQNFEMSMVSQNPRGRGVFSGQDVVLWMTQNEIVTDENHALWLGKELLRCGVLERVDPTAEAPLEFVATLETLYRLPPGVSTASPSARAKAALLAPSPTHASTPRAKRSSSSPVTPSNASVSVSPRVVSFQDAPSTRKPSPPGRSVSAVPSTSATPPLPSRIISPRRKQEIDHSGIAGVVDATFSSTSSPRVGVDSSRSSQTRDGSRDTDEQRSVVSTSQPTTSAFERLQPELAIQAFEAIESAMETHILATGVDDNECLRQQLQGLKDQLDAVQEYVIEKKKKRHVAVESAFGESFEEKKARLRMSSRNLPRLTAEWDCVAFIVKSNDDLRQEVLCLQLIRQLQDIFQAAELPLRLLPYRIIATSASTGMIEYIKNATSLDSLKKRLGYTTLANHFVKTYGDPEGEPYKTAMANYVRSMAAYSLACYFLQIKDRHNGNIMIDSEGHVVHIDFGFILGIAPGGRFSLETAPFKLTSEMVEAMGGTQSEYFKAYVILLIQGFLALQQHADTVLLMIAIMAQESSCPCFLSQNPRDVLNATKALFKLHFNQNQVIKHVLRLVRRSHNSYRTRQYDVFQKLTNGILP